MLSELLNVRKTWFHIYDLNGNLGYFTSPESGYKGYCILYFNYSATEHGKSIFSDRFI